MSGARIRSGTAMGIDNVLAVRVVPLVDARSDATHSRWGDAFHTLS